jgi:hypothetical protein
MVSPLTQLTHFSIFEGVSSIFLIQIRLIIDLRLKKKNYRIIKKMVKFYIMVIVFKVFLQI